MKRSVCLLSLVTCCWLRQAPAQTVVEGKVVLPSPAGKAVPLPHYPGQIVQPSPPEPPTAVVYLLGNLPAQSTSSAAPVVQMSQRGLQFIPNLLPIQVGTVVEFPNYDDLYHNVFSYSKPKRFDLGRYRRDEKPAAQRFDKPGLIKLNCEIHAHMRAYILALDTPYFARTDTNGHYRMENLPEGRFVLKAWLNEKTTLEEEVELRLGQTLRVDFRPARPQT